MINLPQQRIHGLTNLRLLVSHPSITKVKRTYWEGNNSDFCSIEVPKLHK